MQVAALAQAAHLVDQARRQHGVEALRERAVAATRQLAKRQLTWLRGMPYRTVIAADAVDALAQGLAAVALAWGPPGTGPR